jgi:hypothetical protein
MTGEREALVKVAEIDVSLGSQEVSLEIDMISMKLTTQCSS